MQGIIVGVIICAAILYLIRRHFKGTRSSDPCAQCSCCDKGHGKPAKELREDCGGAPLEDFRK